MDDDGEIVEIGNTDLDLLGECCEVIRTAFLTVAQERGLTPTTAPAHPSNTTVRDLERMREAGASFYAVRSARRLIGCVAMKLSNRPGVCYLERLAVIPSERHRGHGRRLLLHVAAEARKSGCRYLSVAIIDDDERLKSWYRSLGFVETGTHRFDHLPFTVCYMAQCVGPCREQHGAKHCGPLAASGKKPAEA